MARGWRGEGHAARHWYFGKINIFRAAARFTVAFLFYCHGECCISRDVHGGLQPHVRRSRGRTPSLCAARTTNRPSLRPPRRRPRGTNRMRRFGLDARIPLSLRSTCVSRRTCSIIHNVARIWRPYIPPALGYLAPMVYFTPCRRSNLRRFVYAGASVRVKSPGVRIID